MVLTRSRLSFNLTVSFGAELTLPNLFLSAVVAFSNFTKPFPKRSRCFFLSQALLTYGSEGLRCAGSSNSRPTVRDGNSLLTLLPFF